MSKYAAFFLVLDLLAIISLLVGIFTSSFILYLIKSRLSRHHAISNLLLANTCICTLELCLSNLIIYGFILIGDFESSILSTSLHDQQYFCPIRSYFLFTGFCLLYTSYCLQAYYRLRQVIFYKKHSHYHAYIYLIFIQWTFSFLFVLPMLLSRSFVYIPTEHFCPIPFDKPFSVAYIAIGIYGFFLAIFGGIYLWIYIYTNRTTSITIQRRRRIDRQFTMFKRMFYPTFSLIFLGIAYLILFFHAIINQYQTHFLTYRLGYLFIAIGMSFIHIITIFQTPSIRRATRYVTFCFKEPLSSNTENILGTSDDPNGVNK